MNNFTADLIWIAVLVSEYVANFKTVTRSTLPRVDSFPIQKGSFSAIYQYTATFYCMTFNLYYFKFNFRMNPTYKSALKALNRANFGLNAGLLSRAQQAKQRACRGRRPALRGAANCTASNQKKYPRQGCWVSHLSRKQNNYNRERQSKKNSSSSL